MQQLLSQRKNAVQNTEGVFPLKKSRQVTYKRQEKHIQKMESKLMEKYRLGYSQLNKLLVLKTAQQEFSELNNLFL